MYRYKYLQCWRYFAKGDLPFKGKKEKELKVKDSKCQRRFARRPIPDRYGVARLQNAKEDLPKSRHEVSPTDMVKRNLCEE